MVRVYYFLLVLISISSPHIHVIVSFDSLYSFDNIFKGNICCTSTSDDTCDASSNPRTRSPNASKSRSKPSCLRCKCLTLVKS